MNGGAMNASSYTHRARHMQTTSIGFEIQMALAEWDGSERKREMI